MQIYATLENRWPTKDFTYHKLSDLGQIKYKYTYENTNYTGEQILKAIKDGHVNLKNCWKILEVDTYRKLKSGLPLERSPAELKDPRTKKTKYDE